MTTIPVSGTYTDMGVVSIEVSGVLYEEAWHIHSEYIMYLTDSGLDFTRDYPASADYWYVEGMGLVKELHTDIETLNPMGDAQDAANDLLAIELHQDRSRAPWIHEIRDP